ncbi:MAG: PIG-L family deacetylase [Nitrospinae bacterium]|nr:PIG-L family deacetylase [Nitrospinota bacterium]
MIKILFRARNFLDFMFFSRYLSKNRLEKLFFKQFFSVAPYPDIESAPHGKKVCVISPHIDDDAIGCGGFISLLKKNNCSITVYYIDGGDEIRRKEAEELQRLVHYDERIFGNEEKIDFSFILKNNFDIILLPDYFDNHHFHHQAAKSFFNFLRGASPPLENLSLYFYEIWSPLVPNVVVDISSVIDAKKEYINVFASQSADKDYARAAIGLNQYRSLSFPARSCAYAEAFFKISSVQLVSFLKRI